MMLDRRPFLGEYVGWKQIAGVALCLAGIALVTSR